MAVYQIGDLSTIPQAPADADVLAIEAGGVTYKVSKSVLASAILAQLGGDPVTVAHGGTGAATAEGARTNLGVPSTSEMEDAIQQSTAGAILALDIAYDNISVPASGSTNVSYTVPMRDGYVRAWATLWKVSGSGTGNLVTTIHGDATGGTIYLSSGSGNAITANFTLRVFYVKSSMYSNIT